ncbi:MAG: hypothetical protein LZF63_03255, partial [Nitrosomonas sp.]|nr:hypothetical protein [Nitrosomonas sp.]
MPKAALLTGSVDLTLSSSDIGSVLPRLLEHPTDFSELLTQEHRSDEYGRIYNIVRNNTAFKLADYKSATVKRRIARRMSLLGIYTLEDYAEYLKNYKEESHLLVRDTFISVTYFFRDKDAFSALEDIINASINNHNNRNKIIRCWIPGCASGEEVYSIAMLFEEAFRKQQRADLEYMIFASDLDDAAVERARIALYPSSEMETVPKEFLDLYTEKIGEQRRIKKRIRNRIVFTRQNVIEDP